MTLRFPIENLLFKNMNKLFPSTPNQKHLVRVCLALLVIHAGCGETANGADQGVPKVVTVEKAEGETPQSENAQNANRQLVASAMSSLQKQVEPFTLLNCDGQPQSLSDFDDSPLVVLAFLGTECPLAKLYGNRLQSLQDEFGEKGLKVVAINSNEQDTLSEMRRYLDEQQVRFPFLKDSSHRVANQIGATRTPEVFLLDRDRVVRYQGRIDDQYSVGKSRNAPNELFLKKAIEELLSGKPVSAPKVDAVGCLFGRTNASEGDAATYANQISRIIQNRCVECHRDGQIGPFSMSKYEDVAAWAEMIDEVVQDGRMPPWHADPSVGTFTNDRHLTDEEKVLIKRWVATGAAEGDPQDLPQPRSFVQGWQLPQLPDLVVPMADQPFQVPAEGVVKYQYFVTDPGFIEDKYVRGCQVMPGNPKVVHHILIFAVSPGKGVLGVGDDGFLFAYVPGLQAQVLPHGMAKRIPAGSKLLFQVHYTPIGTPQEDLSSLGILFADPKDITHEVYTAGAVNKRLEIPPHAADYISEATSRETPVDCELLCMSPHMHVRGSSFYYEAVFPDGTRHPLLNVPNYDFNWQTDYRLSQPVKLPKGTTIHCVAGYDNSSANAANPDPAARVRWGDQTTDEMLIGYFTVITPISANRGGMHPFDRQKAIHEVDKMVFGNQDKNRDGRLVADEVEPAVWVLAQLVGIEANGDGAIDRNEFSNWLDKQDNPLALLDNPVIQRIPQVQKLLKRLEAVH